MKAPFTFPCKSELYAFFLKINNKVHSKYAFCKLFEGFFTQFHDVNIH